MCTPRSDPGKAMFEKRERAAVVEDRGTSSQREQETSCRLLIRMHPFRKAVSSCPPHISSPTLLHYIPWLTSVWDSSQTKAQLNCRYFSIPTPIIQNLLGLQKKKKKKELLGLQTHAVLDRGEHNPECTNILRLKA